MATGDTHATAIRRLIDEFLHERLQPRLDKLSPDDPKYVATIEQYQRGNWIGDAARRVSQLQVVTHSLKPIHPDAKGTNLYTPPDSLPSRTPVGSHALPADFQGDVVGNAAALDVYKFLRLEYDEQSLLERVLAVDEALIQALSDDRDQALEWVSAFAAITQPRGTPTSHTRAKQLYWLSGADPTDNDHYHLLAPLYATSLTQHIFQTISADRFGETAKEARKARKNTTYSADGYHDYLNLAVQKLGGTKPQNISQLNSERGGQNYLLASLPPAWVSRDVRPPLRTDSVFRRFARRPPVRQLVSDLKRFLESDPERNYQTRDLRDNLTAVLADELVLFTLEMHRLPPGWTQDDECRLDNHQQYWLDPGRAEIDDDFRQARRAADWPAEICAQFAQWLNHVLSQHSRLTLGDTEHRHWVRQLEALMENFLRQLDDLQDSLGDAEEEFHKSEEASA